MVRHSGNWISILDLGRIGPCATLNILFKCSKRIHDKKWKCVPSWLIWVRTTIKRSNHPVNAYICDCCNQRALTIFMHKCRMDAGEGKPGSKRIPNRYLSEKCTILERVNVCRLKYNIVRRCNATGMVLLIRSTPYAKDILRVWVCVCVCSVFAFIGRCFMRAHTWA